ncbi:DsbA family protein [Curtobacterium sp. RRHDQ10]|uniref:DsbA family protein n=1 Tax=Curtobacterium phyllosphaerae TaxID=3413379 RepID=UPI003BF235E7
MTNRPEGTGRPADKPLRESRNHRRAAARLRAQKARAQQKRRQRGVRIGIQAGIGVVLLAVVAVVTLVLVNSVQPAGPGPANMANGGITIGRGLQVVGARSSGAATPSASSSASSSATASGSATPTESADPSDAATDGTSSGDTVKITLYIDYLCPICGQFEQENSSYVRGLVNSGAATVQIHPIAILTNRSQGTKYSLRAANAAACVANSSPNQFFAVNQALFDAQPRENTSGLDDAALTALVAKTKGITHLASITRCIQDQEFAKWVDDETTKVTSDGIPHSNVTTFSGTPTILVNGKKYDYSLPFSNAEFRTFIVTAAGSSFAAGDDDESATPTPSPTPTAD